MLFSPDKVLDSMLSHQYNQRHTNTIKLKRDDKWYVALKEVQAYAPPITITI